MSKTDLTLVVRNDSSAAADDQSQQLNGDVFEEWASQDSRGIPKYEIFEASSLKELKDAIDEWIELNIMSNPEVDGVQVMSPTVSADGEYRATVNYLRFLNDMGPWF